MTSNFISKISKVNPFILITISFVVGLAVMYLYFQPKLAYKEKTAKNWANIANKNHKETLSFKDQLASTSAQLASASAEIKTLLNRPPEVIYKTQYVETPAQQNEVTNSLNNSSSQTFCNPDQLGGQWCYSGNTQTHCTPNGIGGMYCQKL